MPISIVTINYNNSENTIKLLESLKNQTDKDFGVIVVDNNSHPDQKSILKNYRTEETNITLVENDENLGYSGGNNIGIKRALESGASWVILLNNDTVADTGLIGALKSILEGKEGLPTQIAGILGIALDEGDHTACAGKIEWLKSTLPHITTLNVVITQSEGRCLSIKASLIKLVFWTKNIFFILKNRICFYVYPNLTIRSFIYPPQQ